MNNALTIRHQDSAIVQADTIADMEERFALAVRQRELLADYIMKNLDKKRHFYEVAGSRKPSLNKDGAEVIGMAHGLKPRYIQTGGPDQPPDDDRPYQITVQCQLFTSRGDAGEGLGSANSHITKHDGTRVARQKDPGLRHNSTLKMAQKSAYICAILASTAASEFFTQDMGPDEAGTAAPEAPPERGSCPVHHAPFQHRQGTSKAGKSYDFWACPEKTADGKYCQERPGEAPEGAEEGDAAPDARTASPPALQGAGTVDADLMRQLHHQQARLGWSDKELGDFINSTYGQEGQPRIASWLGLTVAQRRNAVGRMQSFKEPPKAPAKDAEAPAPEETQEEAFAKL